MLSAPRLYDVSYQLSETVGIQSSSRTEAVQLQLSDRFGYSLQELSV
jgi:hypothetical protein